MAKYDRRNRLPGNQVEFIPSCRAVGRQRHAERTIKLRHGYRRSQGRRPVGVDHRVLVYRAAARRQFVRITQTIAVGVGTVQISTVMILSRIVQTVAIGIGIHLMACGNLQIVRAVGTAVVVDPDIVNACYRYHPADCPGNPVCYTVVTL